MYFRFNISTYVSLGNTQAGSKVHIKKENNEDFGLYGGNGDNDVDELLGGNENDVGSWPAAFLRHQDYDGENGEHLDFDDDYDNFGNSFEGDYDIYGETAHENINKDAKPAKRKYVYR